LDPRVAHIGDIGDIGTRRASCRVPPKLKTRTRMAAKLAGYSRPDFINAALLACIIDANFRGDLLQASFESSERTVK